MLKSRITNSCECDTHYWYFQNKPLQCHCIETVSAFAAETCVVVSSDNNLLKKNVYSRGWNKQHFKYERLVHRLLGS